MFEKLVVDLRQSGDFGPLIAAIPYVEFLGMDAQIVDGDVVGHMRYSDHLLGNARVHALHGGTLAALMETTAIFKLLWHGEVQTVPKTINITVEYLRGATTEDTWAQAEFTRQGRRIANVRIRCWQGEAARPVAVATAHFLLAAEADG